MKTTHAHQTPASQKTALLIVGHGSRDREGIAEFCKLAEHLSARFPERPCEIAFLEFATPTICTSVENLLARGVTVVTVVPGMLMAAGHVKNDIPSELHALQAQYPNLTITYGTELGVHAKILRAARERIESAEVQFGKGYERRETLLMVVGRGSSDPDANSNVCKVTRMLWEGMGFGWAETSFIGITAPLLTDALTRAHGLGFKQFLVFPYFLFTGRLVKRIYRLADAYQAQHPEVQVVKANYLNAHPLVLEAFVERLQEAEQGDGKMNCQLCQYRERIIGFEHKLGMPQRGHHHHVRGIGTDADGSLHHDHLYRSSLHPYEV